MNGVRSGPGRGAGAVDSAGRTQSTALSVPRVQIIKRAGYLVVSGDTYHVKEMLKTVGARWDPVAKVWSLPATREEELKSTLAGHAIVEVTEDIAYRPAYKTEELIRL